VAKPGALAGAVPAPLGLDTVPNGVGAHVAGPQVAKLLRDLVGFALLQTKCRKRFIKLFLRCIVSPLCVEFSGCPNSGNLR